MTGRSGAFAPLLRFSHWHWLPFPLVHREGGGGHTVPRPPDGGLRGGVAAARVGGGDPVGPPLYGCSPP